MSSARTRFLYDVRPRRNVDAVSGRPPRRGPEHFIAALLTVLVSIGILGLDAEFCARLFADAATLWAPFCGFVAAIPALAIYRRVRRSQKDIYLGGDDEG